VKTLKTVTDLVTLPARAAGHAAAATLGSTVGAASVGLRATGQVVGWAADRAAKARTRPVPVTPPTAMPTAAAAAPSAPTTPEPQAPAAPAARKAPTAKKAPARKPARKKASSKKAAVMAPALGLSEAEVEDELRTPSGIPAAGEGLNPATDRADLHQPGTEPLMDPGTVKAAAAELRTMQRAADTDKGSDKA
jgi:hypothetical protein